MVKPPTGANCDQHLRAKSAKVLRASLEHVALISAYLHDAVLDPNNVLFDRDKRLVSIELTRVWHEQGKKGKFLWIIPVYRYPWIQSVVTISNVEGCSIERTTEKEDDVDDVLLYITMKNKGVLEFVSKCMRVSVTVTPTASISVRDISMPSNRYDAADVFAPIFRGLKEIDNLRTDPDIP